MKLLESKNLIWVFFFFFFLGGGVGKVLLFRLLRAGKLPPLQKKGEKNAKKKEDAQTITRPFTTLIWGFGAGVSLVFHAVMDVPLPSPSKSIIELHEDNTHFHILDLGVGVVKLSVY